MKCRKVNKLLETYIDGDLTSRAKEHLERHLKQCSACSNQLEKARETLTGLKSLNRVRTPEGFTRAVMARLPQQIETQPHKRLPAISTILHIPHLKPAAIGAAIILAVLAGYFYKTVKMEREIEKLIAAAQNSLASRKIDEAATLYRRVIELNPKSVEGHFGLAYTLWLDERIAEAIAHYRAVIQLITKDKHLAERKDTRILAAAYESLGKIHHAEDSPDEAIRYYELALEVDPDIVDAHYNLAIIYEQRGMFSQAISEYKAVVELEPTHSLAYESLGRLYERSGALDEAVAEYQRCIEIADSPTASLRLGRIYERFGMLDEAVAAYQIAAFGVPNRDS